MRFHAVTALRLLAGTLGLGMIAGCGTSEPGLTPAIGMTISKSTLTIAQGGNDNLVATISRTGGYTGTVTVAVDGAPAGVSAAVTNLSTTGGTTTGTVTVTVGAAVVPGTFAITVRASGSGVTDVTSALSLIVTAAPAIAVTLTTSPVSIGQGLSGTVQVAIARTNFTGNVTLALEGAPAGVTGSFNPAPATGTTSVLTIQVGAAVPAGNSNLIVRATGTGLADATAPLVLTVTAVAVGNYTLSLTPAGTVTMAQGTSATPTVNIDRTGGFTGSVGLTVVGAPAGLTATLNPTSTTGNSSVLTLAASGSLAVGTYPLTVQGTATGVAAQALNVSVVVTAPAGSGNVTLDYAACAVAQQPIWAAFQDGTSGTWTQVVPVNNMFNFNVTQPKVGYAVVLPSGAGNSVVIQYFSQAELTAQTGVARCPAPSAKTVTGSVANLTPLQVALVSLGGASAIGTAAIPGLTFNNVATGPQDLVGYAGAITGPSVTDRVVIQRDQNPANGGSVGTVDFTGASSFAPASATITLGNLGGGEVVTQGMFYLAGAACRTGALYSTGQVAASPFTAYGVPALQQRASDLHGLFLTAATGTSAFRTVIEYFNLLANRTVALPAALPVPTVAALGGPYKRLQFQFVMPAEYAQSASVLYSDAATSHSVAVFATVAGYLAGQSVNLSVPDFSAVAGWNNTWAPATAATVNWTATGAGSNVVTPCTSNGRVVAGSQTGTN